MPFNVELFERSQFQPRTARVPVPDLAPFFAEGEPREWEVRNLTGAELFRANDAAERQKGVGSIVDAIGVGQESVEAIRKALGIGKGTPPELAKRLEMLVAGSVSPKIELAVAVKLAEHYPVEFAMLTREITNLTGMGAELVKPVAASHETVA
jgi:hypothetical protein